MGGLVQRSTVPAFYLDRIEPKTLDDKLSASGAFVVKSIVSGSGGMLFGWFNSEQLQGSGDPSSFGMLLIFEKNGGRISVRMHNRLNQTCGTFVTPYIPGRYRPTQSNRERATTGNWTMIRKPNHGDGQFQYSIRRLDSSVPVDDFEDLVFTVNLRPGFKKEGAVFDRFGLTNARKTGGTVEIYFDDLHYSGKSEDFSKLSASWEGSGNRGEFKETIQAGAQDFGWSPETSIAGGAPGEVGGCSGGQNKSTGGTPTASGP